MLFTSSISGSLLGRCISTGLTLWVLLASVLPFHMGWLSTTNQTIDERHSDITRFDDQISFQEKGSFDFLLYLTFGELEEEEETKRFGKKNPLLPLGNAEHTRYCQKDPLICASAREGLFGSLQSEQSPLYIQFHSLKIHLA